MEGKDLTERNNEFKEMMLKMHKDYMKYVGLNVEGENDVVRDYNVGTSNYAQQLIQPWTLWAANPDLHPIDCDILKRVLRRKSEGMSPIQARILDYQKIIHCCKERERQLNIILNMDDDELAEFFKMPTQDTALISNEIFYRNNKKSNDV